MTAIQCKIFNEVRYFDQLKYEVKAINFYTQSKLSYILQLSFSSCR